MTEFLKVSELSGYAKLRLWWGFFWRGTCITVASTIGGGLVGFLFGVVGGSTFAVFGIPRAEAEAIVTIAGGLLGLLVGGVLFYVYIRWLLGGNIGGFRLLLVRMERAG